jgi:glycerophosphoryl diester phosphodiesterase
VTARPLVFGHRGSSAALPEHTRAAYLLAIEEGADGLECDVRLTRDGQVVCVHDAIVDRTSDGRGRVSAATLADLDRLDFGSWHHSRTASRGVLTLDALVTLALDADRPLRLLIETKHPSRFGGVVEERVIAVLRQHGLISPAPGPRARLASEASLRASDARTGPGARVSVTVMSFSPLAVRRMRTLAPDVPTVFLFEFAPPAVRDGRAPFGASLLGPGVKAVRARPDLVRRAQERGHQVYVWTVNRPEDIDLMVDLGVDGIITDRPADVVSHLGRRSP